MNAKARKSLSKRALAEIALQNFEFLVCESRGDVWQVWGETHRLYRGLVIQFRHTESDWSSGTPEFVDLDKNESLGFVNIAGRLLVNVNSMMLNSIPYILRCRGFAFQTEDTCLPIEKSPTEKKCTVCKRIKPITEFYEDARRQDGHYSKCKKCHNKSVKKWQINNSSKFKEINSSWKKTHKEQRAAESKEWAKAHPEYRRKVGEKWRSNHPDYGKNWRNNNRAKIRHYAQNHRVNMQGNGGH